MSSESQKSSRSIADVLKSQKRASEALSGPQGTSGSQAPQVASLEEAQARLSEQGITAKTVLTDGSAAHETMTEWQCRHCRRYNSAVIEVDGIPRIVSETSLRCWKCGRGDWMTVEYVGPNEPYHDPNLMNRDDGQDFGPHPGVYVEPDIGALHCLQNAEALIDEAGLFPSDVDAIDKEPSWPRQLAVALLGGVLHLGESVKEAAESQAGGIDDRSQT